MAGRKETTSELRARLCSLQDGRTRYCPDNQGRNAPRLAHWRNNLTALSSRYDLLFTASVDQLLVQRPMFPQQTVSCKGVIFKYASSSHRQRGFIDPSRPHAANQLIVDHLGLEEVLLLACDDGDIIGYRTSAILDAYEASISSSEGALGPSSPSWATNLHDPPRPFFLQNVGKSAWGLAVHATERMIAVR